jgi:uncharacterized phage-associated protein
MVVKPHPISGTAPYDAREVANFFLDYGALRGMGVTVMSMLKIIYFAHGWHLARYNSPLVKNAFEAWKHGPVVRVVYECFREAGEQPITSRATRLDPVTASSSLVTYSFCQQEAEFLEQIFRTYSTLHAFRLSDLTHEPGSPWDDVWNGAAGSTTPGMKLSNASIRAHFMRRHCSQAEN